MKELKVVILNLTGHGQMSDSDEGLEFKTYTIDDVTLNIRDTSVSEHNLIKKDLQGAGCAVIIVDPHVPDSLKMAPELLKAAQKKDVKTILVLDCQHGSPVMFHKLENENFKLKFLDVQRCYINSPLLSNDSMQELLKILVNLAKAQPDLAKKSSINWPRVAIATVLSILTAGVLPLVLAVVGLIKTKSVSGMVDYVRDTFMPKAKSGNQSSGTSRSEKVPEDINLERVSVAAPPLRLSAEQQAQKDEGWDRAAKMGYDFDKLKNK